MNSKVDFANYGWLTYHLTETLQTKGVADLITTADSIIADKPAWVKGNTVARFKLVISTRIARHLKEAKQQ